MIHKETRVTHLELDNKETNPKLRRVIAFAVLVPGSTNQTFELLANQGRDSSRNHMLFTYDGKALTYAIHNLSEHQATFVLDGHIQHRAVMKPDEIEYVTARAEVGRSLDIVDVDNANLILGTVRFSDNYQSSLIKMSETDWMKRIQRRVFKPQRLRNIVKGITASYTGIGGRRRFGLEGTTMRHNTDRLQNDLHENEWRVLINRSNIPKPIALHLDVPDEADQLELLVEKISNKKDGYKDRILLSKAGNTIIADPNIDTIILGRQSSSSEKVRITFDNSRTVEYKMS